MVSSSGGANRDGKNGWCSMWLVWTLLTVVSKSQLGPSEKGENKCPVAEAEAVSSSEAFLLDLVL